ncbi:MAG: 30S ribosomal protein S3 [Chloroflexi bacterium]|nr:MAG: 30S ribosomal protein S3 [Chloroflexota bacterium]
MGHKVHPIGFRLGIIKGWQSRWYAERDYKDVFAEDDLIRRTINKELANASVSRIEIERAAANQVSVTIHTAKPGIVIGKSGEKVDRLRAVLEVKTKKRVRLNILEIRQPEMDAYLVARSVAEQLEKRVSFRRAMKQAVQKSMRANAKGIRIIVGGRLGGAEIARSEKEVEGKIPLHTLRADIDYGMAQARTTFGMIGIKVWIYKGDILPSKRREAGEAVQELGAQPQLGPRDREGGDRRGGDRRRGGEGRQRGDRGERPQGERPAGGDRGPRQAGERSQRPQGQRPPRPQGERTERPPRAQGDRPQGQQGGERTERTERTERPPRPPRPQGERTERPPRAQGDRPPRQQGERTARAEQAPKAPEALDTQEAPAPQATAEETQANQPTPELTAPAEPTGQAEKEAPPVAPELPPTTETQSE